MRTTHIMEGLDQKASFLPFQIQGQGLASAEVKVEEPLVQENECINDLTFYERQLCKLAYQNTVITVQLSAALEQKKIIMNLMNQAFQRQQCQIEQEKQKRTRRCAKDIQRKHKCAVQGCGKSYGTQNSLLQHIKLKHPQTKHEPPLMLDPA